MRRSLVISLFVALTATGALAFSAGLSTAAGAAPGIICPLAGSSSVTCCGPPISGSAATPVLPCCLTPTNNLCCPPGALCVVPLTISSTPNPSVAGTAVTISGRLQGATAGTSVALWQELPGQKSFHKIAQTTTDPSGAYTLLLAGIKVKTDRDWYVASGGANSFTIRQVVKAKVTASAKAFKLPSGHKITITGKIEPSHSGQRVLLEQRISGAWQVLAHVRVNKSRYAVSRHWAKPGVVTLRIAVPADKRNPASFSPVVTVTLNG